MDASVVVGKQGRVVIPAELRNALDLVEGDVLHVKLRGRTLVIRRPADAADELVGMLVPASEGRSLVDELLAERRAETAAE